MLDRRPCRPLPGRKFGAGAGGSEHGCPLPNPGLSRDLVTSDGAASPPVKKGGNRRSFPCQSLSSKPGTQGQVTGPNDA